MMNIDFKRAVTGLLEPNCIGMSSQAETPDEAAYYNSLEENLFATLKTMQTYIICYMLGLLVLQFTSSFYGFFMLVVLFAGMGLAAYPTWVILFKVGIESFFSVLYHQYDDVTFYNRDGSTNYQAKTQAISDNNIFIMVLAVIMTFCSVYVTPFIILFVTIMLVIKCKKHITARPYRQAGLDCLHKLLGTWIVEAVAFVALVIFARYFTGF